MLAKCMYVQQHMNSYVQASMELGTEDVFLLERCPHFRRCYVQVSMELGPEDVFLLVRCPHFRQCYVQALMELGPEYVPIGIQGVMYRLRRSLGKMHVLIFIRKVSSSQ